MMLKIMGYHPQSLADVPHIPPLFAEQSDACRVIRDRMDFARQQLQEGRFPSTIRTEDGDVLTLLEGQRKVDEDTGIAAINRSPFDLNQWARLHPDLD
jgi:hypothetical protein